MYQMSNMVIVNTVSDFQQTAPDIAAAADGTLLVAWQDTRFSWEPGAAGLGLEITSQLLHPDLTPYGAEIVVTRADKNQTAPQVVAKPDGSFVLAFTDGNPPFDIILPVEGGPPQTQENDAVAVVTLTVTPVAGQLNYGTAWNPPDYVNLPGFSYNHSHVVYLADLDLTAGGVPFVTSISGDYNTNDPNVFYYQAAGIYVQGLPLGDLATAIETSGDGRAAPPDFPVNAYSAALHNGGIVTIAENANPVSIFSGISTVRVELVEPSGAHSYDFVSKALHGSTAEGVVVLANGNYVLLWNDINATDTALMGQVFSPTGAPVAAAVSLESGAGIWDVKDVIALSSGGFAVGFINPSFGRSIGDAYIASFDANAELVSVAQLDAGAGRAVFTEHLSLTEGKQGVVYAAFDIEQGSQGHENSDIGVIALGGLVAQRATDVTFTDGTHNTSLAENSANGTLVGTLLPAAFNLDDTFTYSFWIDPATGETANAGGAFALDAAGHLKVGDSLALDFEAPVNVLTVKVVATGQTGLVSPVETLTIALTDVVGEFVVGDVRSNTVRGGEDADFFLGGDGDDSLVGGNGDDYLDGDRIGGPPGQDTLVGGAGDDTLVSRGGADSLDGGAGNDLGWIDRSTLATNFVLVAQAPGLITIASDGTMITGVENFRVTSGTGNDNLAGLDGNDTLEGGAGIDHLSGGGGDDHLDGGTGADVMTGGDGNDVFVVDSLQDRVIEGLNGGNDFILATGNYTLRAGVQVEHLWATGATPGVVLKGNELANDLRGSFGNDQLFGGDGDDQMDGSGGIDRFFGGGGNDFFHVTASQSKVFENVGEGDDTILTDVNFTLAAGQEVEHLRANDTFFPVVLKGNEFGNDIVGSFGSDQLFGGAGNDSLAGKSGDDLMDGGTGADTMAGDFGNDTYVVDDINDVVAEVSRSGVGGGIDTVKVGFTYTLGADVENLTLTGVAAADGFGNDADNKLIGNGADNLLVGGFGKDALVGGAGNDTLVGGKGNDVLTGGAGADVFRFNSPTEGKDVITDFQQGPGMDLLEFSAGNGGALGVGFNSLSPGEDVQASGHLRYNAAVGLEQQFVYFMATGVLAWDANGQLAGGLTSLLVLSSKPPLQGLDFHIVA